MNDQELRTRLLQGDPAAEAPALDPVERAAIRRAMFAAVEGRAVRPQLVGFRLAFAKLSAAALLLGGAAVWLASQDTTPAHVSSAPAAAGQATGPATSSPAEPPTGASATAGTVERSSEPAPAVAPAEPAVAPSGPAFAPTDVPDLVTPTPPDRGVRTVQFTAPRGTRIIWTLDPDFESPLGGPAVRQEQGR